MGYPMFRSTLPLGTAPLTVKTKTGVVIEPPFWWKPNFKPLDPTLGSTRDTNSVLLPSRWFFEFGSQALAPGESLFPFFWNVHILRGSITHFQPFPDIVKWGLFIVKSQWLMVKSPFFHRCRLWKNAIFHNPNPNIYTYIYISKSLAKHPLITIHHHSSPFITIHHHSSPFIPIHHRSSQIPSGKRLHSYWKWWFIVDLPINSMVIFHSYVNVYQAGYIPRNPQVQLRQVTSPSFPRRKGSTSPMSGGWKTCHLLWKKSSLEIAWSADWCLLVLTGAYWCLVGNGWEWTGMDGNGWEWDYW